MTAAFVKMKSEGPQGWKLGRCGDKRDSGRDSGCRSMEIAWMSQCYKDPEGEREKGKAALRTM